MVLLKDNHLGIIQDTKISGLISKKLKQIKRRKIEVEVEVESFRQLHKAIKSGVDIIMLDNMSYPMLKKAVQFMHSSGIGKMPLIEVSGGLTLRDVRKIAELGVERISIGALTHSAPPLDMNLSIMQ